MSKARDDVHKKMHESMLRSLEQLVEDFVLHTDADVKRTSIHLLLRWARAEAKNPTKS